MKDATAVDPPQRLSVTQVMSCLSNHLDIVPLPVSQNSALERYNWFFACGLAASEENLAIENAINACSFLSVVLCDLILSLVINVHDFKTDVISHAEHSDQLYIAQEAYNILRQACVVTNNYENTA